MIEQTDLVVNEWIYMPPADNEGEITSNLVLEVMKKTAPTKKGLACRFTCRFVNGSNTILLYIAEDSYVIDLADTIDKNEVLKMLRNSYAKCKEKYEFRSLGTVLQNVPMPPLQEFNLNADAIVPLLN
jgi:hypothetical protein